MNKEIELLNYIYQNSQMAILSIEQLVDLNDNRKFNKLIRKQLQGYTKINHKTVKLLNDRGFDEKEISKFNKIKTYLMINIQTLTDKSASHLAQMLIVGSTMGVIDSIKNINTYSENDSYILKLINDLKSFEELNIENLKCYL
ncbi:MAG: hypothetical protein R3Y60_05070 [bacterium]